MYVRINICSKPKYIFARYIFVIHSTININRLFVVIKKIKQISMHNPQKQAPRQHANSLSNIISVIIFYFVRLPSGSTIRWYIKCIQFDVKIMYRYILFIAFVLLRSRYQNITVRGCPSNRTKFNIGYPLYFDICNNSFCPL